MSKKKTIVYKVLPGTSMTPQFIPDIGRSVTPGQPVEVAAAVADMLVQRMPGRIALVDSKATAKTKDEPKPKKGKKK